MARFFRLSAKDCRRGVIALASHTGWSLAEILALPCYELMEWLDELPKSKE